MTTLKKQVAAKRTALSYCTLIVISLLFAALAVTLASCFSPWTGEEELTDAAGASPAGTGTVVVSIGGGSSGSASVSYIAAGKTAGGTLPAQSRAAWTDDDMLPWPPGVPLKSLRHDISLAGGTGGPQDATIPVGGGIAEFSGIEPGRWAITVRAYIPGSTPADDELVAMGQEEITVVAGPNPTTTVQMDPLDPDPLTVTFDLNGGTAAPGAAPEPVTVGSGTEINLPTGTGLTRNGYTFAGWCPNSNGEGLFYNDTYTPPSSITLYAKWMRNYTVTFDSNGATTAANPATKTVIHPATTVGTLPTAPERTGYTFAGWKAAGGAEFTAANVVTADITVVAQWTAKPVREITITPPGPTAEPGDTLQFTSKVIYEDNTERDGVGLVRWIGTPGPGASAASFIDNTTGLLLTIADNATDGAAYDVQAALIADDTIRSPTATVTVTPAGSGNLKLDRMVSGVWNNVSGITTLESVVSAVNTAPDQYRLIVEDGDIEAGPQDPFASGVKLEIVGNGTIRTITLSGAGSLFTVGAGAELTLNGNVTLHGNNSNTNGTYNAVVRVTGMGAKLFMNTTSSKITGNGDIGVYVYSNGEFTMNNGEISGNKASGVFVGEDHTTTSESFTMIDGVIKDNIAPTGGGVYASKSGKFYMEGGSIEGNSSTSGAGVYLSSGGRFEMSGGEIKDNHATGNGGGVWDNMGTFVKSGNSTVYGSDAAEGLKNTAGGSGQAVYDPNIDTTLGPGDDLP